MPVVCLQGGNELTAACRPMDELLLSHMTKGQVVVVPLASKPGSDYTRTTANAVRYFTELDAPAVGAPDARKDPEGALAAVDAAGLVFLTGGSPRTLRDALVTSGVGAAIATKLAGGAPVVGSSAGAMVACSTTLLPQWRGIPDSGPGLGLVPGYVVVPHYDGRRPTWVRAALAAANDGVLGIPETSGVMVDLDDDGKVRRLTAVGVATSTRITPTGQQQLVAGVGFEPT